MFTKNLISDVVLERFMDQYSEKKYQERWDRLQDFIEKYKNDKRLYSESAFDAEWIDEIFCGVLGYSKKIKIA